MWWSQRPLGQRAKLYPNKLPLTPSVICFTTRQLGAKNSPVRSLRTSTDDEPLRLSYHTLMDGTNGGGFVSIRMRGKACKRVVRRAFFSYWWFFFWITHEHSTASHLPFRYEAKCLKVSPTATSRQLSMTHVQWKLLSCFITSLLSPHHPSLAILLWRAANQLIENRCPPRASFKQFTSSLHYFFFYKPPHRYHIVSENVRHLSH